MYCLFLCYFWNGRAIGRHAAPVTKGHRIATSKTSAPEGPKTTPWLEPSRRRRLVADSLTTPTRAKMASPSHALLKGCKTNCTQKQSSVQFLTNAQVRAVKYSLNLYYPNPMARGTHNSQIYRDTFFSCGP